MYTYLENIYDVKTLHGIPYNLIGKIKDITLCDDGRIPYYQFTLYNDNTSQEYACVVKESLVNQLHLKEYDSIVIEYVPVNNFIHIGQCFLIRRIKKPVLGLTGNKNEDVIHLMEMTKKLIETGFTDGSLTQSYHGHVNLTYLKFRKAYLNSIKVKK